jgi:uncharacterized repeat protein (TIGR03803 family)
MALQTIRKFPSTRMKTTRKFLSFGALCIFGCLGVGSEAYSQTFTTLHTLSAAEGGAIDSPLIRGLDGNFYGVALQGGTTGAGTFFRMTPAGNFTVLYSFGNSPGEVTLPLSLIQGRDGNFYGTSEGPGSGAIFKITTSGTITTLHVLKDDATEGTSPEAPLVQGTDGAFYGSTFKNGDDGTGNGSGTIFKLTTDGTAAGTVFTTLHFFPPTSGGFNDGGGFPEGAMIQAGDGNFYGTTESGGLNASGIIFKITPGGTFTQLHEFRRGLGFTTSALTPAGPGLFYGTASVGLGNGAVYQVSTDGTSAGTQVSVLYDFNTAPDDSDGAAVNGGLAIGPDGDLYGSTGYGAAGGNGTIFSLTPGGPLTTLHTFSSGSSEAAPHQTMVLGSDGNFYGTTFSTIFKIAAANPPPPAPPNGGLSATVFRVNGRSSPSANVADTVLRFTAQQTGRVSGLVVRVQATTTPSNAASWNELSNGSQGYMTYDPSTAQFVLNSTNYPLQNGVYFRVTCSAPGYPDSISDVVGPFSLATSTPHLGPTTLFMATNGGGAEMRFRVKETSPPAGILLRIQATTTPDNEASWTDLNDGNSGHMSPYSDPTQFYLDSTKYPTGDPVYFRAVAQASGYIDSISNEIGVTHVVNGIPPTVDVLPPRFDQLLPGSGSGTNPNDPLLVSVGTFKLGAQASSSEQKPIKRLVLLYDGVTINDAATSGDHFQMDYTTSVPGDHVVKAAATDERGVVGYADPIYLRIVPSGGKLFKMVGSGSWNNAANWQDGLGNNGVPGVNDFAIIDGQNASITQNITVYSIALVSGSINGSGGALTVSRFFSIVGGQLKNIDLTIDSSGVMAIGDTDIPISGSVTNYGKIRLRGHGSIVPVPNGANAARMQADGALAADGFFDGVAAFFKNAGEFIFHHPSVKPKPKSVPPTPPAVPRPRSVTASAMTGSGKFISDNGAAAISHDGGSAISHDGGSIINNGGSTLIGNDGASLIGNDGASIIGNDGASLLSENGLGLLSDAGIGLKVRANGSSASASTKAETAAATSGYVQTGGETNLDNVIIAGDVSIDGGVLSGSGIITGSLTNNGGYIVPGHSAGAISVVGDFTQGAQGTIVLEKGGTHQGEYDRLQIRGTANLGGNLEVRNINSYVPDAADTFNPLGYSAVTGSFASVTSNTQLSLGATGAIATVNPAAPNPSTGQPLNIATRMGVQKGDNVLIAGFIVTGAPGSTKKVLIRGLGPSLAQFGVPGTLTDPLLELHKGGETVINDNWQQGDTSQIPNGFAPSDPREAVIVATLAPGNYSAVVKGAHGETGVGIAEVYDLDTASPAKLANISTRGFINTGDDVMIGGFIVGGNEPAKILVRAIGPTLGDFGVQGALADPTLELHDSNGASISNDDWRETQESEIIATTIPPNKDREPAILATLAPGNYTAVVRGKNNTTGIGLVEAYNLQ